jgi:hypothetical protein
MIRRVFTHGNREFSQSWFEVKKRHPASILRPFHQLRQLSNIFLRARRLTRNQPFRADFFVRAGAFSRIAQAAPTHGPGVP